MRAWRSSACTIRGGNLAFLRSICCSPALGHRINVANLVQGDSEHQDVEVHGWVRSVRKQKNVAFAALGDGSTIDSLQAVLKPEQIEGLSTGTAVRLKGSWVASGGKKQRHELQVASVQILGENDAENNPVQPKYQTAEFLRTIPHLRPRIPGNALLLRLRSQVIASLTRFFNDQQFVQTHTPIITSSDCEGAGEVFTVSSNAAKGAQQHSKHEVDAHVEHFFRAPKYLTVSAQLHLEALALAVDKVWTLSPTFRAEKSDTPRHLSEFYMLEAEQCFIDDAEDVMDLVETMLRAVVVDLGASKIATELKRIREMTPVDEDSSDEITPNVLQQRWDGMAAESWPRITYADAIQLLGDAQSENAATFAFAPSYEEGLAAEHERYIASTVGKGKPVFVKDYPQNQKPFYMAHSKEAHGSAETVACFDLLVPDLCELVGGSVREYRSKGLLEAMREKGVAGENLEWYQDLRKYGSVPHGGFGLGFDRLLCYLSGVGNVRDVVAFPRWHNRCDC